MSATSRITQLGHRQTGLRDLDPGELQPGPARQRDLAAAGPDRLPDRLAGRGRSARRAGGRSSATAAASSRPSTPRRSTRRLGIRKEQIDAGPALAELHRDPLQRHAPHGRLPLRAGHELGRAAGRPRPLLPRLQPPAALRPRRPAEGTAQSRRRCWAGCRAPGASRPTSTASSACGPRACSTPAAPCASAIGGSTGNGDWPASGPRSGSTGETLTIEYATETLAQYRVTLEADGRRLREVGEPRLFATDHASPQPFLRRSRRRSGTRRGGWRPTGRAARGRHRQRKRGSLRRDTTRLAGVAGPRRPSQCLLAGIIDRHLTPLPPRRIIPDDRFI